MKRHSRTSNWSIECRAQAGREKKKKKQRRWIEEMVKNGGTNNVAPLSPQPLTPASQAFRFRPSLENRPDNVTKKEASTPRHTSSGVEKLIYCFAASPPSPTAGERSKITSTSAMHGGNSATVVPPRCAARIQKKKIDLFLFLFIKKIVSRFSINNFDRFELRGEKSKFSSRKFCLFVNRRGCKVSKLIDRSNFYNISILFEETFQYPGLPRLKRRNARQCKLFCSFDVKFHVSNFADRCSFRFIRVTAQDSFAIFMQLDFQAATTLSLFVLHAQMMMLKNVSKNIGFYTMYTRKYTFR